MIVTCLLCLLFIIIEHVGINLSHYGQIGLKLFLEKQVCYSIPLTDVLVCTGAFFGFVLLLPLQMPVAAPLSTLLQFVVEADWQRPIDGVRHRRSPSLSKGLLSIERDTYKIINMFLMIAHTIACLCVRNTSYSARGYLLVIFSHHFLIHVRIIWAHSKGTE